MYKVASANAQRRAGRLRLADIPPDAAPVTLAPGQEVESLKARVRQIKQALVLLPLRDRRRAALGKEMHELGLRIGALRPRKAPPAVSSVFMAVAKEMLPPATYRLITDEAHRRAREAEAAADAAEGRDAREGEGGTPAALRGVAGEAGEKG